MNSLLYSFIFSFCSNVLIVFLVIVENFVLFDIWLSRSSFDNSIGFDIIFEVQLPPEVLSFDVSCITELLFISKVTLGLNSFGNAYLLNFYGSSVWFLVIFSTGLRFVAVLVGYEVVGYLVSVSVERHTFGNIISSLDWR